MAKAIFTAKPDTKYSDLLGHCYHFPKRYLKAVESALSDWIIYYEPRRFGDNPNSGGGRSSYFATAQVLSIEEDPDRSNHFYAYVSGYFEFARTVPFRKGNRYYEARLRRSDGKTNKGAFGHAVRKITDQEYEEILRSGFDNPVVDASRQMDLSTLELPSKPEIVKRPLIQQIVTRPFRDAAFAKQVKKAYKKTCAVTGIKLVNSSGQLETQAAHIQPVAQNGPDEVRNGIALSSTIHWMFDHGMISIDDDFSILIARRQVPGLIMNIINPDRKLKLPEKSVLHPHPQFLKYHRDNVFAG